MGPQRTTLHVLLVRQDEQTGDGEILEEFPIQANRPLCLIIDPPVTPTSGGRFTITLSLVGDDRLELRLIPGGEEPPEETEETDPEQIEDSTGVPDPERFRIWMQKLMDNKPHEGDNA